MQKKVGSACASNDHESTTHIENGEFGQDGTEFLVEAVLAEFNLAHIKASNPTDFKILVNLLQREYRFVKGSGTEVWTGFLTVGVFLCVLLRTISKKSLALGTGAIPLSPLAAMLIAVGDGSAERGWCEGGRKENRSSAQAPAVTCLTVTSFPEPL